MNPWPGIPLADYEGHMQAGAVRQLGVLSELFAEALAITRPASVAIIGIAGGNGLEHIDGELTRRVLGFDINPAYLEAVRRRYPQMERLELVCVDLSEEPISPIARPVELVHAALVFEHAGVGQCLDSVLSLVAGGGMLSVVLQLPAEGAAQVGESRFASMQRLNATFTLIDPARLIATIEARGFRMTHQTQRALTSGKGFWMGIFTRAC